MGHDPVSQAVLMGLVGASSMSSAYELWDRHSWRASWARHLS